MNQKIQHALFAILVLAAILIGAAIFQKEAYADENTVTYKLTTLDGETVTEKTYGDRVQLLAFYKAELDEDGDAVCWNSGHFLSSLQQELDYNWVQQNDVMLILVPCTDVTDEQVRSFISRYGSDIGSDNVIFTKADPSLMWSLCGNDTIRAVCCMPVKDGQRLDFLDNVSSLADTRKMMGEYIDLDAMYQIVQVTADYHYDAAFEVLDLVNQARSAEGLNALTMDEELLECAMQRAAELSILNEHTRPNGERGLDISPLAWGENIAVGQDSPDMVMGLAAGWMGSEGHRENILSDRWSSIGIGAVVVTCDGEEQYFWCQLFGEDLETEAKASDYTNVTKHPKINVLDHYLYGTIGQAINYEATEIPVGQTEQAHLNYFYVLGSCTWINTEIYPGGLTYTSSDPTVASVSDGGLITAIKAGKAQITLRSKYSSPKATDLYWFDVTVVSALPVITSQPADQTVSAGETAVFTVKASGEGLKYQWYYRDQGASNWNKATEASGKTASFQVTAAENMNGRQFYCAVSNGADPVNSSTAKLSVKAGIAQPWTVKAASSVIAVGATTTVSVTGTVGRPALSYRSSDAAVASVSTAGKVTAKKVGTVWITVTAAATGKYKTTAVSVKIFVVPAATSSITCTNQAGSIKVTWSKVTGATGYYVYRNGTKIADLKGNANVTYTDGGATVNGGKYTYKIVPYAASGSGTANTKVTYYVSRPAISTLKSKTAKKATVTWKKNAKASGYQIRYSLTSDFSSDVKTVTVTKASTLKKVLSKLTSKKIYYVQLRSYKTVSGIKYYSAWSASKSIKVK